MLIEGKSPRYISDWLKEQEPREKISHTAINNYRKKDFNVQADAAKEYNEKQSKDRKKKASGKVVNDIQWIDKFLGSLDPEDLKTGMEPKDRATAANRFLNTKYKILGVIDEGQPVNVNLVDVDDIEERLVKQLADDLARQSKDKESPTS